METSASSAGTVRKKKCSKCGVAKSITEFGTNSNSADGHQAFCKSCKNNLQKTSRIKNPFLRLKHHTLTRVQRQLGSKAPSNIGTDLEKYLGYRLVELKAHLKEELWNREQITLQEAFRRGYHADHIHPLSKYTPLIADKSLQDPASLQAFRDCWHFSNLRMISAEENLAKSDKIIE